MAAHLVETHSGRDVEGFGPHAHGSGPVPKPLRVGAGNPDGGIVKRLTPSRLDTVHVRVTGHDRVNAAEGAHSFDGHFVDITGDLKHHVTGRRFDQHGLDRKSTRLNSSHVANSYA